MKHRPLLVAALVAMILITGCSAIKNTDFGSIVGDGTNGPLDEATVVAGLQEALKVGSDNATTSTSTVDGFLGNQLIRIAIPEQLQTPATTLRSVGLGSYVDELEVAMNRAAEEAASEVRQIFWNAITSMSISDAFAILRIAETTASPNAASPVSAASFFFSAAK
ncbi:MAG: hypothetical protein ACI9UK_001323 [Candidatus Krumholzibacteriia bacterium]|jgi:hypothetical protein